MQPISRRLRNVSVLAVMLLLAASTVGAQAAPALPPGITPQQVELWKQMLQSGQELPPEAKALLEARPDLKEQLPADVLRKVEGKEPDDEAARKRAGAEVQEAPILLPAYDWKKSIYVGGLFSGRLQGNEATTVSHFGHELF
ncbi:MAG: hypothetical protein ACM31I_08610, partial [Deltaproteobacteria bacterium]